MPDAFLLTAIDAARDTLHERRDFAFAIVLADGGQVFVLSEGEVEDPKRLTGEGGIVLAPEKWLAEFDEEPAKTRLELSRAAIAAVVHG